jgi:hypothetical protein
MKYTKINSDGKQLAIYDMPSADSVGTLGSGESLIEGEPTASDYYYNGTAWVQMAAQPASYYTFNWTTKTWEDLRTLADVQAAQTEAIKQARISANQSTFTYSSKDFSMDQYSRIDIDGINAYVVLNNALPSGWVGEWRAIDNTFVSITTVSAWNAFYAAMIAQIVYNYSHSYSLKTSIASASSISTASSFTW